MKLYEIYSPSRTLRGYVREGYRNMITVIDLSDDIHSENFAKPEKFQEELRLLKTNSRWAQAKKKRYFVPYISVLRPENEVDKVVRLHGSCLIVLPKTGAEDKVQNLIERQKIIGDRVVELAKEINTSTSL